MEAITEPCPEGCGGQIIVGMFDAITVPRLDEQGAEVPGEKVRLRLPRHKVRLLGSVAHAAHDKPEAGCYQDLPCKGWEEYPEGQLSKFDPTGLAPSYCAHGLAEHPDPEIQAAGLRKYGPSITYIRAKYVEVFLRGAEPPKTECYVCRTGEVPDDLTTPRVSA